MATMAQFSRNIRKQGSQIENSGTRLIVKMSRKALRSLVNGTPVDKGVARSNWRVGVGSPTRSVISAYSPGRHLGIGERANASAAIAAGNAKIDSARPGQGRRFGTSIYINNNVSYIYKLNTGSSKQSSPGFIEAALLEAEQEIIGFRAFTHGYS